MRKIGSALVFARLRLRFSIGTLCLVADRGMISEETIKRIAAKQL